MTIIRDEAVERATEAREATEDPEARDALAALLETYRQLQNSYAYLRHQGTEPEPWPPAGPLTEADGLEALADRWREEADTLRSHGAEPQAATLEDCAEELEAAAAAEHLRTVTLEEAEEIGGYSYSHLQHLVADGTLPNAGRAGAPRLRLQDVPRKPGHGSDRPEPSPDTSRGEWLAAAVERE